MTTKEILDKYPVINKDWKHSTDYCEFGLATTICNLFTLHGFDIPGTWSYDKYGYNQLERTWFVRQQNVHMNESILINDPWNRRIPCYGVNDETVVTIKDRNYGSLELRTDNGDKPSMVSLGRLYVSSVMDKTIFLLDIYLQYKWLN